MMLDHTQPKYARWQYFIKGSDSTLSSETPLGTDTEHQEELLKSSLVEKTVYKPIKWMIVVP